MVLTVGLMDRKEYKQVQFELHEAYAIDIIISTGEGKVRGGGVGRGGEEGVGRGLEGEMVS